MIRVLNNARGVTLLETLATAAILAFAMISIYTGIIYADKQIQRNYHDRLATLIASGEMDWQYYNLYAYKDFAIVPARTVVLDNLARGRSLYAQVSVSKTETFESPFGLYVPYKILEVAVKWTEPGDKTQRKIVVREDFY